MRPIESGAPTSAVDSISARASSTFPKMPHSRRLAVGEPADGGSAPGPIDLHDATVRRQLRRRTLKSIARDTY
jgi:hypothetical protein